MESGGAQGSAAASVPPILGTSVRADHRDPMRKLIYALNDPQDEYWNDFDHFFITLTTSDIQTSVHGWPRRVDSQAVDLLCLLANTITNPSCTESMSERAWTLFYALPKSLLASRSTKIKLSHDDVSTRLTLLYDGDWAALQLKIMELRSTSNSTAPAPSENPERALRQSLAKSAMSQVHMGHLSRAMARLQSHGVHIPNEGTLEQASLKFPDEIYPTPFDERITTRQKAAEARAHGLFRTTILADGTRDEGPIDPTLLGEKITKGDSTKSPGVSGLRLNFLTPLIRHNQSDKAAVFVRTHAAGRLPGSVAEHVLRSALLVPLKKSSQQNADVRPVVLQEVLHNLAGQMMLKHYEKKIADLMDEHQFAVGRPGGADQLAIIMSTLDSYQRKHWDSDEVEQLIALKIDFANAFNMISRRFLFRGLIKYGFEGLIPMVEQKYGDATTIRLVGSEGTIRCVEGTQQGDALAMFLFTLVKMETHRLWQVQLKRRSIKRGIDFGFADDDTVVGQPKTIFEAFQALVQALQPSDSTWSEPRSTRAQPDPPRPARTGLKLQIHKCTVSILGDPCDPARPPRQETLKYTSLFVEKEVQQTSGLEILGIPIGTPEFVQDRMTAILQEKVLDRLAAIDDLTDDAAVFALLQGVVDKTMNYWARNVPPELLLPAARAKDDAILNFFMRRFNVDEEQKETTNQFLFTRFDLGGFGCISTEVVSPFAIVGNIAANIAILQHCARKHQWPTFIHRALDFNQDTAYWNSVRTSWSIARKVFDDGALDAQDLEHAHKLPPDLLKVLGCRPATGRRQVPSDASESGSGPSTSVRTISRSRDTRLHWPFRSRERPVTRSTTRHRHNATAQTAAVSGMQNEAVAAQPSTSSAIEQSFISLEDCATNAYGEIQKVITQRDNLSKLRARLQLTADAPQQEIARKATLVQLVGRHNNPFAAPPSTTRWTGLSGKMSDAIHVWMGLPIPAFTHMAGFYMQCACGWTVSSEANICESSSQSQRAFATRQHVLGCSKFGRSFLHDKITEFFAKEFRRAHGHGVQTEKVLPLPPNRHIVQSQGGRIHHPPKADLVVDDVPISSSSASRDPHVAQLIVDFKTFEPAARHHINSMQRQDQRLIPQQELPTTVAYKTEGTKRYHEDEHYGDTIPLNALLYVPVLSSLGSHDKDTDELVHIIAQTQLAHNRALDPDVQLDRDAQGLLEYRIKQSLAVTKIVAYVQQERYRQHRMANHSHCFYRRTGHHHRRQLVLPDPIAINRQSARLRAYGVDLRTSVMGRRPVRRLPPPTAAAAGADVAAGAVVSHAAETNTRHEADEADEADEQQEAETFLHNLAFSDEE